MESFFHTLKTELIHHQRSAALEEARLNIFAYIESFYNQTRRHSAIGYINPVAHRQRTQSPSDRDPSRLATETPVA